MHFTILFQEFYFHSRIARLFDWIGKHSTLQCRNSVSWQFVGDGKGVRLKGGPINGS